MLEQQATIIAKAEGVVWVVVEPKGVCKGCETTGGCRAGFFSRLLCRRRQHMQLKTQQIFELGESVLLRIPERFMLRAALLIYLLPIFCLFLGALVGGFFDKHGSELWAILSAVFGFFVGVVFARRWSLLLRQRMPIVIQKLSVSTV